MKEEEERDSENYSDDLENEAGEQEDMLHKVDFETNDAKSKNS